MGGTWWTTAVPSVARRAWPAIITVITTQPAIQDCLHAELEKTVHGKHYITLQLPWAYHHSTKIIFPPWIMIWRREEEQLCNRPTHNEITEAQDASFVAWGAMKRAGKEILGGGDIWKKRWYCKVSLVVTCREAWSVRADTRLSEGEIVGLIGLGYEKTQMMCAEVKL